MILWATKRRLIYLGSTILIAVLFVSTLAYLKFHKTPSCFDGNKNGDETGIDCGGSCNLLCSFESLPPIMRWDPKIFKVASSSYNLLAYIENPNVSAEVPDISYVFKVYGKDSKTPILEKNGKTFIPRNKTFAVFEGPVNLGNTIPTRITFDWTTPFSWQRRTDSEPEISVKSQKLINENSSPKIEARVENLSLTDVSNIELIATVFDGSGNVIGASRTVVDSLSPGESAPIVFTWPKPFDVENIICESPVDVALVVDKSAKENFNGINTSQINNAVSDFIKELKQKDQVSLTTFAYSNASSTPAVDRELATDTASLVDIVNNISLSKATGTDLSLGISSAKGELISSRHNSLARMVLVIFSKAFPTLPTNKNDTHYPEEKALAESIDAKQKGIEVYTIGIDNNESKDLLQSIASKPDFYFPISDPSLLSDTAKKIASSLCKKKPNTILIIPRIIR